MHVDHSSSSEADPRWPSAQAFLALMVGLPERLTGLEHPALGDLAVAVDRAIDRVFGGLHANEWRIPDEPGWRETRLRYTGMRIPRAIACAADPVAYAEAGESIEAVFADAVKIVSDALSAIERPNLR